MKMEVWPAKIWAFGAAASVEPERIGRNGTSWRYEVPDGGRERPQDLLRVAAIRPPGSVDVTLLEVSGEVDLFTVSVLDGALATAVAEAPLLLVIDMTAVSFLASIGITALVNARRSADPRMGLRVVAPDGSVVARALELTGLRDALTVVSGRDEAMTR